MLANEKLDPEKVRHAEELARQEYGDDWRTKRLDAHFAELMEAPEERVPEKPEESTLFPWWHVMLTAPTRERKAAERLLKVKVPTYWPCFSVKVRRRGKAHTHRLCAVMPGLIFAPRQIMAIDDRDAVLKWAGISNFIRTSTGLPTLMGKADIEVIRHIEAKLNLPPEAKGVFFKVGQTVQFKSDLYANWGDGVIFEIASEARIGLEIKKLFGRVTKVYVPASEIEAK